MSSYEFNLNGWTLVGKGENKEEAWCNAVEALRENCHKCIPDANNVKKVN